MEQLPTHGGSLRVFGCHLDDSKQTTNNFKKLKELELSAGLRQVDTYSTLQAKAEKIKNDFVSFLIDAKKSNAKVAGYGAAAKGNTLINFSGIKPDLLPFVCDLSPEKLSKFLPGSHIPVLSPDVLIEYDPDFVIIFPWNIAEEIKSQLSTRLYSTKFVTFIPELKIHG